MPDYDLTKCHVLRVTTPRSASSSAFKTYTAFTLAKHHDNSNMAAAAAALLTASKHKADSSSSSEDADTHMDRNSAIALSIVLFLVLVAIAWYLRLHLARKQQADLERQLQAGEGHFESTTGRVTWDRRGSSCAKEMGRARSRSLFKLKPVMARKDSVAASSSGGSPRTETGNGYADRRKWPGLSQWRTQDSRSLTLGPNTFAIHENTLPLTSTERPPRTLSRQQTHIPLGHTPARRRSSLLSQDTFDQRWWNEVARRGSTTSSTRRSSVLDAVPEPEVRGHAGDTRAAAGSSTVSRDHGTSSTGSTHASWRGSRCESVMYDWTRPADAGVHAKSEANFGGMIRDRPRDGRDSKEKESVECMDWALKV